MNVTVDSLDRATTSIGLDVAGTLTFAPGSADALGRELHDGAASRSGAQAGRRQRNFDQTRMPGQEPPQGSNAPA